MFIYANGGYKVASGPERVCFVEAVLMFDLLFEPGRRFSLQYLCDVGDGISGCREDTEVNMVILNTQFDDFPVFPLTYGFEDSSQFVFYFFRS